MVALTKQNNAQQQRVQAPNWEEKYMALTKNDYEKIIHFINQTHGSAADIQKNIQTYLSKIFHLDHSLFWFADNQSNMYNLEFFNCDDQLIWDYTEIYRNKDLMHPKRQLKTIANRQQAVLKINETTTPSSFTQSDYYPYFRRHEIIDQMVIYFTNDTRIYGGIGFSRFKGDKPFTPKDRQTLQALSNHLHHLVKNALKMEELKAENLFLKRDKSDILGIIQVNATQNVSFYNDNAQNIVEKISTHQTVEGFFQRYIKPKVSEANAPTQIDFQEWNIKIVPSNEKGAHSIYIYPKDKKTDNKPAQELLSNRELELLDLVMKGYTNDQIAEELWISINTVKKHLRNMYQKTGVTNRTSLIYKLIET